METPSTPEQEVELPALDVDPWMRFDMWAGRSWEASDQAVKIALERTTPSDDVVDDRIIALFHAASVAKEFASMTNPFSIGGRGTGYDDDCGDTPHVIIGVLPDNDD